MNDFDPDAFLKGAPATPQTAVKAEKPTSDFDPDAFLGETKTEAETTQTQQFKPEGPAPQGYVPGPAGYNWQAIKQTVSPLAEAAKGTLGGYVKNPVQGVIDVGAMHFGLPPPYASVDAAKGLYNTYGAARAAMNTAQGLASKIAETPGVEASFNKLIDALPRAEALRMNDLIYKRGAQGLKEFLDSAPEAIKAMPEAKELAGMVPSRMAQAGKVVAPVLRTAGKVLGPAGLALNAYDASQYAQAAELGKRLAEGQGGIAQQTFRNVQHNIGSQYQLQPQEAANVLASGDQATINLYGGPQRLNQIAGGQSPSAPPTSTNFVERMRAMAHQYGMIKQ
jgi:hypothetical protein